MAMRFGPSPALPAFCYLAGIGVPLAVIDARCQRLPDALTLSAYPVALALMGLAALLLPGGARHFLGALAGLAPAWAIFLFAAAAGLALIAARRASRKSRLPFGPYLLAGTFTAILLSSLITASGR
jgi:leader peptidase (prepilin peptidase)/N-methyltransferase